METSGMARIKKYRESKRMQSSGYRSMKDYDMADSHVAQTYTSDWSDRQEGAMEQYSNGSMDYYNKNIIEDPSLFLFS